MALDEKEKWIVTQNMLDQGGGFVRALAIAIRKADPTNYQKLKNAFPEYWKQYYNDRKLFNDGQQQTS